MKLYIANKNYSSWSFRPWLAMRVKEIDFEELLIPFNDNGRNPKFYDFSPTGKVPALVNGDVAVWESLAILEYLTEKFPERALWPQPEKERAHARAIAHEMHGGFDALRSACPMNMRRNTGPAAMDNPKAVQRDVTRIETLWQDCLDTYGGPFLFGEFTNADAMFAPVVNRLEKYALSKHPAVTAYSATIKALPAWVEWEAAALAESRIVEADEA
ncbi:MAG: glutathione S-transferase family protein [Parvularculales bacterium]